MENKRSTNSKIELVSGGDFFKDMLSDLGKGLISNSIQIALEKLNKGNEDSAIGMFLYLLGGTTGTSLSRIEAQLAQTKAMISNLQTSVNSLIKQVADSFNYISLQISMSNFEDDMKSLSKYYEILKYLLEQYQDIIAKCCDEDGKPKSLSDSEKAIIDVKISAFMDSVKAANLEIMLLELNSMTNPQAGFSTYYIALDYFKKYFAFKHQMYRDMYYLYNLISNIRTIGLELYKEYQSFNFEMEQKVNQTQLTLQQWLDIHYYPIYKAVIAGINNETQENPLLNEMGMQLVKHKNEKQDKDEEIMDSVEYLESTINQKLKFIDQKGIFYDYDVFCIDSNVSATSANASQTATGYVVVKHPAKLDCYTTSEIVLNYYPGCASTIFVKYHHNRLLHTFDYRYKAVDVPYDLNGLLDRNKGTDQVRYLVENLPGFETGGNGFVLKGDELNWKKTFKKFENDMRCYYDLKLLDAHNYSPWLQNPTFLTNDKDCLNTRDLYNNFNVSLIDIDKSVSGKLVYKKMGLKNDMEFYLVFMDTNIKYSGIPIDTKTKYYKPVISSQMPHEFNMDNGDVLDLSNLNGSVGGRTINVNGNARIIGGGSDKPLSELNINLYEKAEKVDETRLTLENLHLTVSDNYKINVKTGTGTIVISGNSEITGAITPITSEKDSNIIIKEEDCKEKSLTVVCTSDKPAIDSDGNVTIIGVSNLNVCSAGTTSINAKGTLNVTNSTITSTVSKESNDEFKAGSNSSIDKTTLNMSYGILNNEKISFSNCEWTGNVRYKFSINTGMRKARKTDCINMIIKNDANDSLIVDDITKLAGDNLVSSGEYVLYFSKKEFNGNYASVTFTSSGTASWYPSYCSLDSATFSCNKQFLYKWVENNVATTFYADDICVNMTIKTADVDKAGTAAAVSFSIVHDDGLRTPFQRFDNTLESNTLEQNANEVFTVSFGRASEIKNIEGLVIKSDCSGNNPGWKVDSIYLENLNNSKDISLKFFPNLWIVNTTEKLFGVSEDTNGLFEFTVKTSDISKAGTNATLHLKIDGTKGSTDFEVISGMTDWDAFEKNNTDIFSVAYSKSIGTPQLITITTDGDGKNPDWYCEYIDIRPLIPNSENDGNKKDTKKYHFVINKWIEKTGENYVFRTETI